MNYNILCEIRPKNFNLREKNEKKSANGGNILMNLRRNLNLENKKRIKTILI